MKKLLFVSLALLTGCGNLDAIRTAGLRKEACEAQNPEPYAPARMLGGVIGQIAVGQTAEHKEWANNMAACVGNKS